MYENSVIIDAAQFCKWDREYFEVLNEAKYTAVGVNLGFHTSKDELLNALKTWDELFKENDDLIKPLLEAKDIKLAKKEHKTAIYFSIQNPKVIEDDLSLLKKFKEKGVLSTQLVLEKDSLQASSCYEDTDRGLLNPGKKLIAALNNAGMLCDLSFASTKACLEAVEFSKKPLCMSHALPYSFHVSPRNKSDEVLKALAKSGGMLALSLYPVLLPNSSNCALHEFCQMLSDLADMIGIDALAIGSDLYEGQSDDALMHVRLKSMQGCELQSHTWPPPLEWYDLERGMYVLFETLFKYSFFEDEIKAILGGNWQAYLDEALKYQDV